MERRTKRQKEGNMNEEKRRQGKGARELNSGICRRTKEVKG